MSVNIPDLDPIGSVDGAADLTEVWDASLSQNRYANRNTYLGLSSAPVGTSDTQTLTNKTLTSPAVSNPTLSGTLAGTYTIGGTPTFPSSVVTLTGSQTLTNKTLTSPTINTATISNPTLTTDTISEHTAAAGVTIDGLLIKDGAPVLTTPAIGNDNMKLTVAFRAYDSAGTSLNNITTTTIGFATEEFDYGSNYNTSTNTFTAPYAGLYLISAGIGSWATATRTLIDIEVNGVVAARSVDGANRSVSFSTILYLPASAAVKVLGYQATGGTQTNSTLSYLSWFSGFLIGRP